MPSKLHSPTRALGLYLDEMLHQGTDDRPTQTLLPNPTRVLLPSEIPVAESVVEAQTAVEFHPSSTPSIEQLQLTPLSSVLADRPANLELPVQCLMFKLGVHLLSIPLVQLSAVVSWNGEATRLPESPEWILGLIKHRNRNIQVVDSYLLFNIEPTVERTHSHLLVLDDADWAITCDSLEQVVSLDYADVQWLQNESKPLVLGTIRASLSMLLNPLGIAKMLNSGRLLTTAGSENMSNY